jgi:hypothetical protein
MTDPDNGAVPPVPPPAAPVTPPSSATPPPASPPPAPPAPGYTPPAPGYTPPAPGYTPPAPAYTAGGPVAPKTLSLIGLIAGIVGLLGFWIVFIPIVGSILQLFIPGAALVLGILGRKREGLPARGFWLAAIITGIVGLVIAVIALIGWIVLFAIGSSNGAFTTNNY